MVSRSSSKIMSKVVLETETTDYSNSRHRLLWKTAEKSGPFAERWLWQFCNKASLGDRPILHCNTSILDRGWPGDDRGMTGATRITADWATSIRSECLPELSRQAVNMANTGDKPCMNWQAANLATEWRRFRQHCDFAFKGPLCTKT